MDENLLPQIKSFTLSDAKNIDVALANGQKKIYVFLPPAFDADRTKKYKAIYIFDGQNAFDLKCDAYTCSAPWSWGLDLVLKEQADYSDYVVVGIFNGEGEVVRDTQLTMSQQFGRLTPLGAKEYGHFENGQLEMTERFMRETLLPFVWQNFNVSKNACDATVLGASSGGLASLYVGLKGSDLYGSIGAFSPATGLFYTKDWQSFLNDLDNDKKQRIYIYCGKNTQDFLEQMLYSAPDNAICSADKVKDVLINAGFNKDLICESFIDGGIHNEEYWHKALPQFINFIKK